MWIVAPSSAPADKFVMSRETHHGLIKAVLTQHNQPRSEPPPRGKAVLPFRVCASQCDVQDMANALVSCPAKKGNGHLTHHFKY